MNRYFPGDAGKDHGKCMKSMISLPISFRAKCPSVLDAVNAKSKIASQNVCLVYRLPQIRVEGFNFMFNECHKSTSSKPLVLVKIPCYVYMDKLNRILIPVKLIIALIL